MAQPAEFVDQVLSMVLDPQVQGWSDRSVLQPVGGSDARVLPPTYLKEKRTGASPYAESIARMPAPADGETHEAGTECRAVVLDRVGSQSGRAESALLARRDDLRLPGIDVSITVPDEELGATATRSVSSWQMPHRHVDAFVRLALHGPDTPAELAGADGAGKSLWESPLGVRLRKAQTGNAWDLYRFAPNSCIYGFWLSAADGKVRERHRLARSYSSEIVGYGARPLADAATLVPIVPVPKDIAMSWTEKDGFEVSDKGKLKPSQVGLGGVPSEPETRGFLFDTIRRTTTLSFATLRTLRFPDLDTGARNPERDAAAVTALVTLALAGHAMSQQDLTLRSGCELVLRSTTTTWVKNGGDTEAEPLPLDDAFWIAAVKIAVDRAAAHGLTFEAPVTAIGNETLTKTMIAALTPKEPGKDDENASD